jgi:hypothetical protein
VPILFDQEIHIDYGQFYVESTSSSKADRIAGRSEEGVARRRGAGLLFPDERLGRRPHEGHRRGALEASFPLAAARVALLRWAGEARWVLLPTIRLISGDIIIVSAVVKPARFQAGPSEAPPSSLLRALQLFAL